ncbi:MAG: FHA domain-containing protein [Myxococcota bacterium]
MPVPRAPAYLLSLLSRQWLLTGEKFATRYPHQWLVWEPGEWTGPAKGEDVSMATTRLPSHRPPDRPPMGDALCFELKPVEGLSLKLGRADTNDIILNDMTVSREHLRLTFTQGRWYATPGPEAKLTSVAGQTLGPGGRESLRNGDSLKLGGITLTFLESATFMARVKANAPKA